MKIKIPYSDALLQITPELNTIQTLPRKKKKALKKKFAEDLNRSFYVWLNNKEI
jgi:hypothetical protein